MTAAYAEFLAVAGWNELKNIAIRYQRAFPTLLPSTYSRGKFFFQHTDTQRTQASFRAFADGLFGYNGYRNVFVEPIPQPDLLLRVNCTIIGRKKFPPTKAIQTFFLFRLKPFDFCDLWMQNTERATESEAFEKGKEYRLVISNVNKKLGWADGFCESGDFVYKKLSPVCNGESYF